MPSSITLTVSSLPKSTSFFLSALQPLAYVYRGRVGDTVGFGLPDQPPDFWICQELPGVPAGAAHVAFPAGSEKKVQEFFVAALKAGGKVHGDPQLRDPETGYYSAAIIDFDGNSIEAVYRPDLIALQRTSSGSKSTMGSQAAPSVVSKATTAKPGTTVSKAPTQASKAPSQVSKAPTQASKAPTQVSKAPTQVSKAPTQASKSPTQVSKAPTQVSKAPTQVSAAPSQGSRAPTQVSRAPSYAPSAAPSQQYTPQTQVAVATAPNGEVISNIVTEARGAIGVAREIVNQVRPALDSSNSAPNLRQSAGGRTSPQSHQPSDTIVGTLLGVAAGAALHYAYTKATKDDKENRPIARTVTDPNMADEGYVYYQEYARQSPYAIESPPSEYTQARSQRYITMDDNDPVLSDFVSHAPSAASGRPRRRSSFSGVSGSKVSAAKSSVKMLEAPPTSYRAPTAITMPSSQHSRRSSRHHSDEDLRSTAKSHASRSSRRSSGIKSQAVSRASSPHGSERTVVPASRAGTKVSRAPSSSSKRPEDRPLPPSRAGTWANGDGASSYLSSKSKPSRTVVGKLAEREKTGGRSEVTKSVVGKVEDVANLDLTDEEVGPDDSVSQISSSRGSRSSKRSKSKRH